MRHKWPVEDNHYHTSMDTWPTDYTQMDFLMASNNPLKISDTFNNVLKII